MSDVITVENISVAYKLYAKPLDIVQEMIFGGVRHEVFWALKDVSISVKEGERVGVVGPNGAGKTTLLKAIAGNLTPVSGKIAVVGRVSSLLSMVPAWNAESSGIENIRFNLLLQGVPARQISSLTEEIVEFTELGPFIYQPVKTYSTGMGARLSFAIATASNPEILIVDEVLGTGDGYFAAKAYQRMRDFCARGRALLFVSHAVAAVQQMCDRAVWIQDGSVRMDGPAIPVLSKYELDYRQREDDATRRKDVATSASIRAGPSAAEVTSEALRLRIVPVNGLRFFTTHYVRAIRVTNLITHESCEIPLSLPESEAIRMGGLDVMSSEWGRIHERHGSECRILQRVAARNSGGQIILGRDLAHTRDGKLRFKVEFEYASQRGDEELGIQVLDLLQGEWRFFEKVGAQQTSGGWQKITYEGAVELPQAEVAEQIREQLIEEARAKVEIQSVDLVVNREIGTRCEGAGAIRICRPNSISRADNDGGCRHQIQPRRRYLCLLAIIRNERLQSDRCSRRARGALSV